jgi:hypothetical protein
MDIERIDVNWTNANVWSWDQDFPNLDGKTNWAERCAFLNATTMRIQNTVCLNTSFQFACKGGATGQEWIISNESSIWIRGLNASGVCPTGYEWAAPSSGLEMSNLVMIVQSNMSGVWLNYTSFHKQNCWGTAKLGKSPTCLTMYSLGLMDPYQLRINFSLDTTKISTASWDNKASSYTNELSAIAYHSPVTYNGRVGSEVSFILHAYYNAGSLAGAFSTVRLWSAYRKLFNGTSFNSLVDFTKAFSIESVNLQDGTLGDSVGYSEIARSAGSTAPHQNSDDHSSNASVIAGAVIAVFIVGMVVVGFVLWLKQRVTHGTVTNTGTHAGHVQLADDE